MQLTKKCLMPRAKPAKQARREDVSAEMRRLTRSLSWFIRGLLLFVLLGLVYWAWTVSQNPQLFPIKNVRVQASYQHLSKAMLREKMLPFVQKSFFNLHLSDLRTSLLQNPWVSKVMIKRVWPSRVDVKITEMKPVAKWNGATLITANGTIFAPPISTQPHNLPNLWGPPDQQQVVWENFDQMAAIIQPLKLHIVSIDYSARHAWSVQLSNGIEVLLGRQDILLRLKRMALVYEKALSSRAMNIKRIDLRYTNGLAVAWRDGGGVKF